MAPLLTSKQAARELGVSVSHLHDMARAGAIAFVDIGIGRFINRRYEPADIEAFKLSRRTLEAPPPAVKAHPSHRRPASVIPIAGARKSIELKRRYPGPPSNLRPDRPSTRKD